MATSLVEPRNNVREYQLHVLIRLACARIELDGLVCALVEGVADLGLAVQDEERHPGLWSTYPESKELFA
jgi:hypothetical protein